jgi:hypothetical protein
MMRLMQKLLAAALLACYGILGAIATGPHGHDFPATGALGDAAAGLSWQAGAQPLEADAKAPLAHCDLCTWSRTFVLHRMAAACEPAPPAPRPCTFTPSAVGRPPVLRGVLLRAPPTA